MPEIQIIQGFSLPGCTSPGINLITKKKLKWVLHKSEVPFFIFSDYPYYILTYFLPVLNQTLSEMALSLKILASFIIESFPVYKRSAIIFCSIAP